MQKVAVVGAGGMGSIHARAYAKMPNAELVAVCDILPEVAERLGESLSVAAFPSLKKLLSEVEVDVVDVCVPTNVHLDIIKEAAAAKKHICSEKPLARTTGQAMEAVRICEEAGVTLFVAQVVRWFPEFKKLHDLIAGGSVGDPTVVRTSRCGTPPGRWFGDFKQSGGVILDLIIHDFDWLRWCFGKVRRVYARGLLDAGIAGRDYALVTLRHESGVISHVEGSWARPTGFQVSVEIAGTKGLLSFSSKDSTPLTIECRAKGDAEVGVIVPESPVSVDPYYQELEHFINCLEEGRTPDVTAQDGLEAVRICEAAMRSVSTGRPVVLA